MINRATILWLSVGLWGVLTVGCSNSNNKMATSTTTDTSATTSATATTASTSGVSDDSLKSDIQAKLYSDPSTKGGHVNVDVKDGVVTLTGDVPSSDVELSAMKIANGATGVKSVSDQIKVNTALAQNQPSDGAKMAKNMQGTSSVPPVAVTPPPVRKAEATVPKVIQPTTVTIPAGERLSIRTTDEIDSGKAAEGQNFRASLEAPLTSRGRVIVPAGASVALVITGVKSAGRIKGNSELSLRPASLEYSGRSYPINATAYDATGAARGKNTAIKTGIGAAAGALIGGLAGGGKGVAIGSAAGGGAGFGFNALTHGKQVKIPSETVLAFRLQAPLTVPFDSTNPR